LLIGAETRVTSSSVVEQRTQWYDTALVLGGTWLVRGDSSHPLRINVRFIVGTSIVNFPLASDIGAGFVGGGSTGLMLGLSSRMGLSLDAGVTYRRVGLNKSLFEDRFSVAMTVMHSTLSLVIFL
jgi:hypothetical protein